MSLTPALRRMSFRTSRATQREPVLKEEEEKGEKEEELLTVHKIA